MVEVSRGETGFSVTDRSNGPQLDIQAIPPQVSETTPAIFVQTPSMFEQPLSLGHATLHIRPGSESTGRVIIRQHAEGAILVGEDNSPRLLNGDYVVLGWDKDGKPYTKTIPGKPAFSPIIEQMNIGGDGEDIRPSVLLALRRTGANGSSMTTIMPSDITYATSTKTTALQPMYFTSDEMARKNNQRSDNMRAAQPNAPETVYLIEHAPHLYSARSETTSSPPVV